MIFWYFNTTCDKASDRLYVEWINFGSHDLNHNLEKGPQGGVAVLVDR